MCTNELRYLNGIINKLVYRNTESGNLIRNLLNFLTGQNELTRRLTRRFSRTLYRVVSINIKNKLHRIYICGGRNFASKTAMLIFVLLLAIFLRFTESIVGPLRVSTRLGTFTKFMQNSTF